jgi:COP9 signalosome complex subunit 2
VLKLIAPYTRFTLAFIAKQLKISIVEVQDIVGFLILDKRLEGKINQMKGTIEIDNRSDADRTHAMKEWTSAIGSLCRTVLDESEGFKTDDSQSLGGTAMPGMVSTAARSGGAAGHGAGGFGGGRTKHPKKGFFGSRGAPMVLS